mgnify:CR=1 FL=1
MSEQKKINELLNKLELLLKKQEAFSKEVSDIKQEISRLKTTIFKDSEHPEVLEEPVLTETKEAEKKVFTPKQPKTTTATVNGFYRDVYHRGIGGVCSGFGNYLGINRYVVRFFWILMTLFFGVGFFLYIILWLAVPKIKQAGLYQRPTPAKPLERPEEPQSEATSTAQNKPIEISNDLEKFIGENLINKIGIAILVIGVAIGAKYSIENNLINPITRIVLGYLVGLGLLGFGLKLKEKYENFSAVLVSGAMAIMYFITYAAYGYYNLMPQGLSFFLMFVFTAFTVFAALKYNNQIIANIGLVGAYAIPFILSDHSGNIAVLFTYMSIINIGILLIAFKKYWKWLYYASFIFTWLIYFSWFQDNYNQTEHFILALGFLTLFFVTFYITFLAYKLIKKEIFTSIDIILLLTNSFVFYGIGYALLNELESTKNLLGLFTLCNGVLHFIVSVIIYKLKLADRNLFYLVSGLVLVFITIAIPVQLDGNWVTLLWVGEAALLFWIGRTKGIPVYEYLSYPLMIMATLSLYQDWTVTYFNNFLSTSSTQLTPIFNVQFLSSLMFVAGLVFIYVLHNNKNYMPPVKSNKDFQKLITFLIPVIVLSSIYMGIFLEIEHYFKSLYIDSHLVISDYQHYYNRDILKFKTIYLLLYTLLFLFIVSFVNLKKLKRKSLGVINLVLNALSIIFFLMLGLYTLSLLRESYLDQSTFSYYDAGIFHVLIRYISFVFVALIIYASYLCIKATFMQISNTKPFGILFNGIILWVLSSELINIMDLSGSTQSYKLGLSILWGVYSLVMIAWGIWKRQKHLRIGAIVLFSMTLIKLFFYDIAHLGALSKTIVFVSLGVLLLIISFLYNKFKSQISDDFEN